MGPAPARRAFPFPRRALATGRHGLLLLLLAMTGCAPKLKLSDAVLTADAGRTTLVYLHGLDLVRRRGEVEQRTPLARFGCVPEGALTSSALFHVFPGGQRALVYAESSNMEGFDLFGHAGRRLTASCLLDLDRQEGTPLEGKVPPDSYLLSARRGGLRAHAGATSGRLYVWPEDVVFQSLEIIDLAGGRHTTMPLPLERGECDAVETPAELLVVCTPDVGGGNDGQVVAARYGLDTWPPTERTRATVAIAPGRWLSSIHLLPGGRHLVSVSWGSTPDGGPDDLLDIRDVTTGKAAVFFRGLAWAGSAIIEATADGKGFLMGERQEHTGGDADTGRVRHFGFDGTLHETWELDEPPSSIVAPAGGKGFWVGGYSKARWYALKSRP